MGQAGPGLCGSCARLCGSWTAELTTLVHLLAEPLDVPCCELHARTAVTAGPTRGTEGEPVSGSRVPPIPVSVDVLSLLGPAAGWDRSHLDPGDERSGPMQDGREPLAATLAYWCQLVAGERSLVHPERPPLSLLRFLSIHHDWTVKQPWSDEYAADLHRLWVDCKRLTGTFDGKPEPMHGVPCPSCDLVALVRRPGEDGRWCDRADGGCGEWMSDEDYVRWLKMLDYSVRSAG